MNKTEFLQTLHNSLVALNIEDRTDIMYDYEEHFRIGAENGKTDDEMIAELGDPAAIARQYTSQDTVSAPAAKPVEMPKIDIQEKKALPSQPEQKPIFISFIAACGLGLFNLIFVLAPYLGFVGAIIGLFAAAAGVAISGFAMLLAPVLSPMLPEFMSITNGFSTALMMSAGVGTAALGSLMLIGMCYVVKYFWIGTVKYIKWNIRIIQ